MSDKIIRLTDNIKVVTSNRFHLILGLTLLVAVGLIFWLLSRLIIPISPVSPYFPVNLGRVSEIHWVIGRYQPVYLYSFENRGDLYIKAVHRDAKNKIRFMDIYMGNKNGQSGLTPIISGNEGQETVVNSIKDYEKNFKFGQRILIYYISSATRRAGTGSSDAALVSDVVALELCAKKPVFCEAANDANADPDNFWQFGGTGVLNSKTKFRALSIQSDIVN